MRQVAEALLRKVSFPHLGQTDGDTPGPVILCKIAHTCTQSAGLCLFRGRAICFDELAKVSNADQLFSCALSDHDA